MITIGMLLRNEFADVTFNDEPINTDFGTQKMLIEWIKDKDRSNQKKYPLLWFVTDSYNDINDQYEAKVKFILFYQSKYHFKNKDRFELVYNKILNPLYEIVKEKLISSRNINIMGLQNQVFKNIVDADNYGVNFDTLTIKRQEHDFSREAERGKQSIAQEVLDAKIFELTIKINKKLC